MLNKNFQGWLKKEGEFDLVNKFTQSLENLYNTKQIKIHTPLDNLAAVPSIYYNFTHEIISYKNLIYFRLFDLGSSLLPSIEKKNYTTSVLICRAIFETTAVFLFRMMRISNRIKDRNWSALYVEILNFKFFPSWKKDGDIDWERVFPALKKFHINDAIKAMSSVGRNKKEAQQIEKMFFKYYSKMSEICHPSQANRSLYIFDKDKFIDWESFNRKVLRDNFSVNHADNTVFPILYQTLGLFLNLDKISNEIITETLEELEKNKNELFKYQNSSKSTDDVMKAQPVMNKMKELLESGLSTTEIVDEVIKESYKKNIRKKNRD